MANSFCSCANERLTSEGREFIIAAEVEGIAKLRSCRVFVFYLGNSVALTLVIQFLDLPSLLPNCYIQYMVSSRVCQPKNSHFLIFFLFSFLAIKRLTSERYEVILYTVKQ